MTPWNEDREGGRGALATAISGIVARPARGELQADPEERNLRGSQTGFEPNDTQWVGIQAGELAHGLDAPAPEVLGDPGRSRYISPSFFAALLAKLLD